MRQNHRVHGCGERTPRMMGTPCFLLEQAPQYCGEFVPHKIQDSGAPGSGVMEGENTACVSDENPWQNVPNVNFNRDARKIKLNYDWYDNYNSYWAVPSFVRDSPSQPRLHAGGVVFYETDFNHPPSMRPTS
ncbi:MAG TPA: hypothetical protein VN397_02440 [Candidatus Methylomirabilis sp.]|nr:hypothetical protein [Candidatus Methylomirabilis sp.]